jgi:hypothetical protein
MIRLLSFSTASIWILETGQSILKDKPLIFRPVIYNCTKPSCISILYNYRWTRYRKTVFVIIILLVYIQTSINTHPINNLKQTLQLFRPFHCRRINLEKYVTLEAPREFSFKSNHQTEATAHSLTTTKRISSLQQLFVTLYAPLNSLPPL